MRRVRKLITRVQNLDTTVLIEGPTGTGKELVARAIHEGGYRCEGPFVAVNAAAISPELLESELFGHEKGAFTGAAASKVGLIEAADGGTFFFDEVGDLPLELQAKLLRVLEEREVLPVGGTKPRPVDIRVVAATHQDLRAQVEGGTFRRDLYFRLNVFPIQTPALAERREDIPELAAHFCARIAERNRAPRPAIDPAALEYLADRAFPGNVRELRNLIERTLVLCDEGSLGPGHLREADELGSAGPPARGDAPAAGGGDPEADASSGTRFTLRETLPLREVERRYIRHVLSQCGGKKSAAAERLGIHPATLGRKLTDA